MHHLYAELQVASAPPPAARTVRVYTARGRVRALAARRSAREDDEVARAPSLSLSLSLSRTRALSRAVSLSMAHPSLPVVPKLRLPELSCDDDGVEILRQLVDLNRYPVDRLDSAACGALIERCHADWLARGSVTLPGFIREEVRERMCAEVSGLPAFRRLYTHQIITDREVQMDVHAVAGDQIPAHLLLRKLYDSTQLARFLARLLSLRQHHVFQFACPWQCLNVMYQRDAGQRSWHYDGSDFVVTLKLQNADEGGEFEFVPFIGRDVSKVQSLFAGTYEGPRVVSNSEPGTLNIFNGQRTLHRVRATYGARDRVVAVLSYDTRPPLEQTALVSPDRLLANNVNNYGERIRDMYVSYAGRL